MSGEFHLRTDHLTFSIQQCQNIGKDGDKNIYDIDVVFDRGTEHKYAGFIVRAGSLEVALEIIETLGQQTQRMNAEEFDKFKSKHATTVFRILHQTKDSADTLIMFKDNRAHNGFTYVFGKPGQGIGPSVQLNQALLGEIHRAANEWAAFDKDMKKETESEKLKFELSKKT
jgi:hypothetical protein